MLPAAQPSPGLHTGWQGALPKHTPPGCIAAMALSLLQLVPPLLCCRPAAAGAHSLGEKVGGGKGEGGSGEQGPDLSAAAAAMHAEQQEALLEYPNRAPGPWLPSCCCCRCWWLGGGGCRQALPTRPHCIHPPTPSCSLPCCCQPCTALLAPAAAGTCTGPQSLPCFTPCIPCAAHAGCCCCCMWGPPCTQVLLPLLLPDGAQVLLLAPAARLLPRAAVFPQLSPVLLLLLLLLLLAST